MASNITLYDDLGNPVVVSGEDMKVISTDDELRINSLDGSLWAITVSDAGVITASKVI